MIIIRLQGGLGNQLFQYALYREFAARGREVKIDEVSGFVDDKQRRPVLREYFGAVYQTATPEEVADLRDARMDLISRIRRFILGRKSREVTEPADGNFDPSIHELTDAYLDGYWQSERYFPDPRVRAQLKELLDLPRAQVITGAVAMLLADSISETESVSLHVRLGDYLWPGTAETHGGICDGQYYRDAMARIRKLYPEAEFYVFCLDKVWGREHFPTEEGFVVVDTGEEREDLVEFWLMSHCRHHILANSSYSWWAAWLAEAIRTVAVDTRDLAPAGLVVAPSRWVNNKEMVDIYTERMIRV